MTMYQLVRDVLTDEALKTFDEDVKMQGFKIQMKWVIKERLAPFWQDYYQKKRYLRYYFDKGIKDYVICDDEKDESTPYRVSWSQWDSEKKDYVLITEKRWRNKAYEWNRKSDDG